jgi:outer membrane protein W
MKEDRMARRAMAVLTLGLLAALPASAGASSLELRIGGFIPRADSNLFDDDSSLYTVNKEDWRGVTGGAEFSFTPADHVELGLHLDGYGRRVDTTYRDYTRPSGAEIEQSLRLTLIPLGATLRFLPADRHATVSPYVGVGPDVVFYKYEEFGDFIDFFDPDLPITPDHFISESTAFGAHALGGIRFYVNRDIAIVGEAKYLWAHDDMGDDFLPNAPGLVNRIDLSGWIFTGGVHLRF